MSKHPDEYTGLVINDEATTMPEGAKVYVTIETRDWDHFEEMVRYLEDNELPGLSETWINKPSFAGAGVSATRATKDWSVVLTVNAPRTDRIIPAVDPDVTKAEEVLERVRPSA